jgi:hypothetical protein
MVKEEENQRLCRMTPWRNGFAWAGGQTRADPPRGTSAGTMDACSKRGETQARPQAGAAPRTSTSQPRRAVLATHDGYGIDD